MGQEVVRREQWGDGGKGGGEQGRLDHAGLDALERS